MTSYARVFKTNPYHGPNGEFTSKDKAVWSKVGGQKGSNPGGVYEKDGKKHYVKMPFTKGQVAAEEAADKVYEILGVRTMNHTSTDVNGQLASVSEWKDVKPLGEAGWKNLNPKQIDQVANAFVASALTMNWDVVGLVYDNMGVDKQGEIAILDTGGSFMFRAQGEPKTYSPDARPELEGMLSPKKTSGRVYGPLMKSHPEAFQRAAEALAKIPDETLIAAVSGINDKNVKSAIIDRKKSILSYFKIS